MYQNRNKTKFVYFHFKKKFPSLLFYIRSPLFEAYQKRKKTMYLSLVATKEKALIIFCFRIKIITLIIYNV